MGEAVLDGYCLYKVSGTWYPGIKKGEGKVFGEVYEINKDTLRALDGAEGEGSLFKRISEYASLKSGEKVNCWIYIYNRPDALKEMKIEYI